MAGVRAIAEEGALWALGAFASATVLVVASYAGREHLRQDQAAEAYSIEIENKSFCGGLGFAAKSESFARCVNGLTDVRQRARERLEEQNAGLL